MTKQLILILLISFVTFSCTKTVDKEQKRWKYNMDRVELLSQTFPNFKNVLKEVKSKAEIQYVAALKMSNEEEKIEAMSDANRALRPSFVTGLDGLDDLTKEVRDLNKEVLKLAAGQSQSILALAGSMEIEQKINICNTSMRAARPSSLQAANVIVKNALTPLNDSKAELKRIVSELKPSE